MHKKHDVLILNRSWVPTQICDWKVCMSKISQDIAHSLDREYIAYNYNDWLRFSALNDTYSVISTVNYKVAIPEIIVLIEYDRLPIRDVKYSRQTLFQRDKFTCAYCNQIFKREELTVDHVIPRCQGGKSTWNNTITACRVCNALKADRTPEKAGMKMHFKPKKPTWISPLADVRPDHPCKSWRKFMNRTLIDKE